MPQIATTNTEEGNSKTSSVKTCKCRKWVFTLNNYTTDEEQMIYNYLTTNATKWIYGFEVGEEGTPHLQGYMEFKDAVRNTTLKNNGFKRAHILTARGNLEKNYNYCSKDNKFKYGGFKPKKLNYKENIENFYNWENIIINELNNEPDNRSINWIWEPNGCAGKTTFQKWIFTHLKNVVVLSGKSADMKNCIVEFTKKNRETPDIVLINIPRCIDDKYISFEGIESIKDMFFYSGKYEGGMVCGQPPHLYIFANTPPKTDNMSKDRWIIRQILNNDFV